MEAIPLSRFTEIYKTGTINAHEYKEVFSFEVHDKNMVLFIDKIFLNYFDGFQWYVEIDGDYVLGNPIKHQIGTVESPEEFKPPFLAKSYIKVFLYNSNSASKIYECLIDGSLYELVKAHG